MYMVLKYKQKHNVELLSHCLRGRRLIIWGGGVEQNENKNSEGRQGVS